MPPFKFLFRTVNGLEEISSQELREKLGAIEPILFPYGPHGWIKCKIEDYSTRNLRRLRSIIEAHLILVEEDFDRGFSIDHFADSVVERIPACAPSSRRISVSAYSVHRGLKQREIQGAFSKRIREKLNSECDLKDYDTALRVTLLRKVAIAAIDLEIQPGNLPKKLATHPTPLLPPIAYCMIRLAFPKEGEQLLDPMCGCGTIPLMGALEWKNLTSTGSEIVGDYVSCAEKNAEILGVADRVRFLASDIADLAESGIRADIIAVNPPYGIAIPTKSEVEKLYHILFEESSKLLRSNGRIVVITPYPETVERTVSGLMLKVDSAYRIHEGEPPRTIQVIRRA